MKIVLTTTVEVDPEAWATDHGIENTPAAVRADVKTYFSNFAQTHVDDLGLSPKNA